MNRLYGNEEVRRLTYNFLIAGVLMFICAYFMMMLGVNNLNREYISNNKVIAGRILSKYPGAADDIVTVFTKGADESEVKSSSKVLSDYGYDEKLDAYKNPAVNKFLNDASLKVFIFLIISIAVIYFIVINELSGIFKKIRGFSSAAEEIVEGNFERKFPDMHEGDFYILGCEFNFMAKRLKETLKKLQDDKVYLQDAISDISHQLKTPLSAVIMFNSLMEDDESMEIEDRAKMLKESGSQLSRMEWLIKSLLKLARIDAGAVKFKRDENNLSKTIESAISSIEMNAREKEQEIVITGKKDIIFRHDADWLSEAVTNIIKNAVEHTQHGGKIEISTLETPLSVQIFIRDNGEGIKKDELPKIFKRFYKGENSVNPSSIGIGLALTKSIIEGQMGSITVASEEGKGTQFNITFLKTVI